MEKQKTLILVDGHALAYRQYFALERSGMKTDDNIPSWAVYGFFKSIFDLLKNKSIKPDAIAVAFDLSRTTFRTEKYEGYKASRESMPDNLRTQLSLICEGLQAFNIPIYTKEGFEADDVIGTISAEAKKLGHKTFILTGDRDSFQLVDKEGLIKVLIPYKGELLEYGYDAVFEKMGVYPEQIIDYKALNGDTSDNIPGIKGIGDKSAKKLLAKYKTLENILENCESIDEKLIKRCVCEGIEQAKLSKFLATIVQDVDIDFDFQSAKIELPDVEEVTAFLKKMQFYTFVKNINSILSSFNKDIKIEKSADKILQTNSNPNQLGLFSEVIKSNLNSNDNVYEKHLVESVDELKSLAEKLKSKTLIALNIEGDLTNAVESKISGIVVGYDDGISFDKTLKIEGQKSVCETFYIPVSHAGSTNLALDDVLNILKPVLEDENIKKTTFDAKILYNFLNLNQINLNGVYVDNMLASYLKNPNRKHELSALAFDFLNHITEEIPTLFDKKKNTTMSDYSSQSVLNYVTDKIFVILALTKYWQKSLSAKEFNLLTDLETPLAKILAKMEFDGVAIDDDYLDKLEREFINKIGKLEEKIFTLAGECFNINSPKQVASILYEKLNIKTKKKTKNKSSYSTSAEVLEELASDYEICQYLLEHRKYSKLNSTYTSAIKKLISPYDNRIHTTYNQTVTATGRLSSSNPNLQNIPVRSEEGNKIRQAFVPKDREKGYILSADYSQIELRLLAHISGDENLIKAFKSGKDVHTATAASVFGVEEEKVTKVMRYKAKSVNFGIIYGQTKYGLAKALNISQQEAQEFIDKYFETYPKVKDYMQNKVEYAQSHGYVETVYGRKRFLASELASSNHMIKEFAQRAAINQPLQGTAADLIKKAMIEVEKELTKNKMNAKMVIQVHDELVFEVDESELDKLKTLVVKAMELSDPLAVPLVVDVEWGRTWKE